MFHVLMASDVSGEVLELSEAVNINVTDQNVPNVYDNGVTGAMMGITPDGRVVPMDVSNIGLVTKYFDTWRAFMDYVQTEY